MKLLILSQAYPSLNNPYQMMYVHNRSYEYIKQGIDVTVLSFSASKSYFYEGISVFTERSFHSKFKMKEFDAVISHAPNLRNHFRFLLSNNNANIFLFVHGHEALHYNKYYPEGYSGINELGLFRSVYENFKLISFKFFVMLFHKRIKIIFVSNWMKRHYIKNVGEICNEVTWKVIPNSCNKLFLQRQWDSEKKKKYDFVSIRPLSGKKYAVDIIINIASRYPKMKFALYGKGDVFKYYKKPKNVDWFDFFLNPSEIPDILDKSRFALMPTRLDAQGVMMCEMATYGIPLITSNISVCIDVLTGFKNIYFIDNDNPQLSIEEMNNIKSNNLVNYTYDPQLTTRNEIEFISKNIIKR